MSESTEIGVQIVVQIGLLRCYSFTINSFPSIMFYCAFLPQGQLVRFLVSNFCERQEIHESLDIRQQAWCHQKMLIEAFDLRSIQINWLSLARCRKSRNFRGRRLCRWCCGPCRRIIFDIRLNFTLLWRRSFYIDFVEFPVDCVNFLSDLDLDTTSEGKIICII